MYAIIGAMQSEVSLIREQMEDVEKTEIGGSDFYAGTLFGKKAVLVKCGIGKVNAAMCTQIVIDRFGAEKIVNTGIAGGLAHGLKVGDIVIGASALQHDFDLSPVGYPKACMREEDRPGYTAYPGDPALRALFKAAAVSVLGEEKVREGVIASGDQFVASQGLKEELRAQFNAAAAEMEGAAIAQVAEKNGRAAVIVRAISDLADEGAYESVSNFEQTVADVSAKIILEMMRNA